MPTNRFAMTTLTLKFHDLMEHPTADNGGTYLPPNDYGRYFHERTFLAEKKCLKDFEKLMPLIVNVMRELYPEAVSQYLDDREEGHCSTPDDYPSGTLADAVQHLSAILYCVKRGKRHVFDNGHCLIGFIPTTHKNFVRRVLRWRQNRERIPHTARQIAQRYDFMLYTRQFDQPNPAETPYKLVDWEETNIDYTWSSDF